MAGRVSSAGEKVAIELLEGMISERAQVVKLNLLGRKVTVADQLFVKSMQAVVDYMEPRLAPDEKAVGEFFQYVPEHPVSLAPPHSFIVTPTIPICTSCRLSKFLTKFLTASTAIVRRCRTA